MRARGETLALLDVREPWEVKVCAIEGSINIPLALLVQTADQIATDRPVVVICHHGIRSMQAVTWLRRGGIANAVNLQGGIDAWARQIDCGMVTY